jgi:hypothetical protein
MKVTLHIYTRVSTRVKEDKGTLLSSQKEGRSSQHCEREESVSE